MYYATCLLSASSVLCLICHASALLCDNKNRSYIYIIVVIVFYVKLWAYISSKWQNVNLVLYFMSPFYNLYKWTIKMFSLTD